MTETEAPPPQLLSIRACAARLREDGISITHQRLSQLRTSDPRFPPVLRVGRAFAVDYAAMRAYLAGRDGRPARGGVG